MHINILCALFEINILVAELASIRLSTILLGQMMNEIVSISIMQLLCYFIQNKQTLQVVRSSSPIIFIILLFQLLHNYLIFLGKRSNILFFLLAIDFFIELGFIFGVKGIKTEHDSKVKLPQNIFEFEILLIIFVFQLITANCKDHGMKSLAVEQVLFEQIGLLLNVADHGQFQWSMSYLSNLFNRWTDQFLRMKYDHSIQKFLKFVHHFINTSLLSSNTIIGLSFQQFRSTIRTSLEIDLKEYRGNVDVMILLNSYISVGHFFIYFCCPLVNLLTNLLAIFLKA